MSQRAEHIWESVSSATTRSRPIINTRDEPHADPERYRRLHVIVGDSNMSETTTLLKVGSAELVLRLVEAGVPMRDFALDNPIRAIRDMSRDRTGQVKVSLSERPAGLRARAADRVLREGRRVRQPGEPADAHGRPRARPVGAHPARGRRRTSSRWSTPRSTGRSSSSCWTATRHEARAEPGRPADRADRPRLPRHPARAGAVLHPRVPRGRRARHERAGRVSGPSPSRRRPPGPSCAATSSAPPRSAAATTRSTGCTSSSTTRPSAPCSARTPSSPPTSAWTG